MRRELLSAVVGVALSAVPALAQEGAFSDRQIQAQVEQRLDKKDIERVSVGVAEGTVSLSGAVPNAWTKRTAVEQALKVKDVVGVADNLTVTRSENDEALAQQVAKAL